MIHENAAIKAQFPDEDMRAEFYEGHAEGWGIIKRACWQDVTEYWQSDGWHDENAYGFDMAVSYASECETQSRDFSPGEFLCARLNAYPYPDEAWAAYEAGVRHGAEAAYWFYEVIGEGAA